MAYFNNAFYKTFVVSSGVTTAGTATSALAKGALGLVTDTEWKTVVPPAALPANTLAITDVAVPAVVTPLLTTNVL